MNKNNTEALNDNIEKLTENQACEILPVSPHDGTVTIHCGGKSRVWRSKVAAMKFYYLAALACGQSSEGNRYLTICNGLQNGDHLVTDGIPLYLEDCTPLTKEEKEKLAQYRKDKRELTKALDELHRTKGATCNETMAVAEAWNEVSLKIIKLERRENYAK